MEKAIWYNLPKTVTDLIHKLEKVEENDALKGTQYIYVQANGTDVENAAELQAAYNTAKTMSPSATNRITVVAGIGNYDFGSSSFDMDTPYIDLVSLDGNRSVVFNHTLNISDRTEGSIKITANNVFVKGVDVVDKNFTIGDNLNLLKVENCKGGNKSFGFEVNASGTFIDCQGGYNTFGYGGTASGTFTNCQGDGGSFGSDGGTASGTFTNCQGDDGSFGSYGGTASGTFIDCQGGYNSFGGGGGTASGTFTDCVGGDGSFGSYGGTASGTFIDCQGGYNTFGYGGTASGTFTNCQGENQSFGGGGPLTGKLYYCRLTSGTFETVSGAGLTRLCIDGNNDENNQG